ncbi:hypothetical protein F5884DRAFT_852983 [Xylogone sp. PMI_703]|nr:hypothetical protein F5884DRAFT_852983 [Xylogone sp. PMI_703]
MSPSSNFSSDDEEFVNIASGGRVFMDVASRKTNVNVATDNCVSTDYGVEAFSDLDTPTSEDESEREIPLKSLDNNMPEQRSIEDEIEANVYILKNGVQKEKAELDAVCEYAHSLQAIYMREHSEAVEDSRVADINLPEEKDDEENIMSDHAKALMDAYIKGYSEGGQAQANFYASARKNSITQPKNERNQPDYVEKLQKMYLSEYSGTQTLVDAMLRPQTEVDLVEEQAHKDAVLGQQNEMRRFKQNTKVKQNIHLKQDVHLNLSSEAGSLAVLALRFFDEMGGYETGTPQQIKSDDQIPLISTISHERPLEAAFVDFVSTYIDSINETLQPMPFVSHYNLGNSFRATTAHKALTEFMGFRKGWKVTPSAFSIDNAFIAEYDSGRQGPVIGFEVEYGEDVANTNLRYHNLTALSAVAAALAVAAAITNFQLPGKVVLFGVPKAGSAELLNSGGYSAYKVDINLTSQPCSHIGAVGNPSRSLKVEYSSNQAGNGDSEAVDALYALVAAYNAISMLKLHMLSGESIRTHITNGGSMPCTNHTYASGTFIIEAPNEDRLEALKVKVNDCFEASASATGASLKVTSSGSYANQVLGHEVQRMCRLAFRQLAGNADGCDIEYTDDEVSGIPRLTLGYVVPDGAGDAWWNEVQGAATTAGKVMSATALEVLLDGNNLLAE